MEPKKARREEVLDQLEHHGGLRPGVVDRVHKATGVPQADIYGVATFYHLLSQPDAGIRVCQGLSCKLKGSDALTADYARQETVATPSSCLGQCDFAPAIWDTAKMAETGPTNLSPSSADFAVDLAAADDASYDGLTRLQEHGADWLLTELEASGLTGRGGAGFPAHLKWRGVRSQPVTERYIVLNADEGEPGTFKDREVMLRRPHRVIEGLAMAARCLEADDIYLYIRGAFGHIKQATIAALEAAKQSGMLPKDSPRWHFVDGHGAYICGEETALLEALEGRRGMPRMKPPFPVEHGFRGKPTLIQNVETIACLPEIAKRGGEWFQGIGKTQAGSKLYCLSGHVLRPGVYEAPMGTTMRELLALAGGVEGTLKAFSPGGASSGFLPASEIDVPLDFKSLADVGSMLGSAGIVVLNDTASMVEASVAQAVFFEDESCGQCAPCRIGTQLVHQALKRYAVSKSTAELDHLKEVAWGMQQASICGLGQAAALPLESAMKHFPDEFGLNTRQE